MDIAMLTGLSNRQAVFVLSPHLDDAVWSLGGILRDLAAKGHPITVATIFSDTPEADVRKSEDISTIETIGCKPKHLDFPDAILDCPLEAVFDETYVPPAAAVDRIVRRVRAIVPEDTVVLSPGGFGAHADHLSARAVAQQLPNKVVYYEDLPYAARRVRIANALNFFTSHNFQRHSLKATPRMVEEHMRLYGLYTSQRQDHHVRQIRDHLGQRGFGIWMT